MKNNNELIEDKYEKDPAILFQKEIIDEISDPEKHIQLDVQKKTIPRDEYLNEVKERALQKGVSEEDADDIVQLVDKTLWGFGVIDDLIANPDISDIRLISENQVRIKKLGRRLPAAVRFRNEGEYEQFIEFITNKNNTNISVSNAAQVFTDKDSCKTDILRFTLISKLVNSNDRPTLLIRKIPKNKKTFDVLMKEGFCTEEQVKYLTKRWEEGHGFLIAGGNGSGKTTLANAILEETPTNKSAVIIQESEELFCNNHPEMIFRKVIPPKSDSTVSYSLKDLARKALMESFDIIVVGEMKGDEAADFSIACYTGSQCMTTVHSNSAAEAYDKVIGYALSAEPGRDVNYFAKQLQSLDTVVYIENYHIKEIMEQRGWNKATEEYDLVPVYKEGQMLS